MQANKHRAVETFWRWFINNQDRFSSIPSNRLLLELILAKLKEVDDGLFFEMSVDLNPKEFIITASGDTSLFGLVDEIVSQAPKLNDWKFIALKPPKGFSFRSNFRGILFDPQKMWFMPLKKRDDPNFLGLKIGYEDGCNFAEKQIVRDGTFLVLDTGLGERVAATNIQYLEIDELPPNPVASGYGKVTELERYLSGLSRKRKLPKS